MMAVPLVGEMSPVSMLNVVVLPAPCKWKMICDKIYQWEGKTRELFSIDMYKRTIDTQQSKTFRCRDGKVEAFHC